MYSMGTGEYSCDYCGFTESEQAWMHQESDPEHGVLWECESCGDHFCSKCFKDMMTKTQADGELMFEHMLKETDAVYCPDCFVADLATDGLEVPKGLHYLFNIALGDEDLFFDKSGRRIFPGDVLTHDSGVAAEVFEMTTKEGYRTLGMKVQNPDPALIHFGLERDADCLINFDLSKWGVAMKEE